ncbi:MAG: flagellar basal body P-ring protein FlgI [Deltaproteobacteria bacterium]|jgi:flagellar P-ring protein precursor FlgI|nr:flagellar basal body P-ring protein FlgI [Deltaproteobacteria bacterium]
MSLTTFFRRIPALLLAVLLILACASPAGAVRIKDIATFSGMRDNQLVGYGLVIGLNGTGDKKDSVFTVSSMVNMMDRLGVTVDPKSYKPKNVASVIVTGRMPVSSKPGSRMDVTVSSLGDASSLQGGVLIQTSLKGVDGKTYALAQGPLVIGGSGADGARGQRSSTTVASLPGGGIIERGVPFEFNDQEKLTLHLSIADFSTSQQVAERLNSTMGGPFARATDASSVSLNIPPQYQGNLVPLMASVENLEIAPDVAAKIVVDEKTGTVVLGRDVRVARAAVAHGNLQITVQEGQQAAQPGPFNQGQNVISPAMIAGDEQRRLVIMEGATLQELVDGLNAVGASPRDLISILRALKASGALYAELEII